MLKKAVIDTTALWAIDIQLRSEPLSDANAVIIFKAYNSETGVIDHDHIETMKVESVGALIAADPEGPMAQAYTALVAAIKAEYERQNPQ
jgi:hypothetical protein